MLIGCIAVYSFIFLLGSIMNLMTHDFYSKGKKLDWDHFWYVEAILAFLPLVCLIKVIQNIPKLLKVGP